MNQDRIAGKSRIALVLLGFAVAGLMLLSVQARSFADVGNFSHIAVGQPPQNGVAGMEVIPGRHISAAAYEGQPVSAVDPTKAMLVTIVLPVRDQAGLDQFVASVSDPKSPSYGHYITPDQFGEKFGATAADISAVAGYAESQGLSVTGISTSRLLVKLSGSALNVEKAFSVNLNNFVASDGHSYFAADREPSLPGNLVGKVVTIAGLDNAVRPHTDLHPVQTPLSAFDTLKPQTPQYMSNKFGLAPSDVRSIYNWPLTTSTNGAGQTAGLVEFDTYYASDIEAYTTEFGLPTTVLTNVPIDGQNTSAVPGSGGAEVDLDIDMIHMLAPQAPIIVYEEPNGDPFIDMFSTIADADKATTISCSWAIAEDGDPLSQEQAENLVFKQMAAQGQTFIASSGDSGAYADDATISVNDPSTQPYVTSSGGTDLVDSSSYGYVSETSWGDPLDTTAENSPFGTGGGGGISTVWLIPSYQQEAFTATGNPQGSLTMRNTPDISLYGDFDTGGYAIQIYDNTTGTSYWAGYNGTSATAPLWAGFLTDVNQERALQNSPVLGFVNPTIYAIAEGADYSLDFHDIKDGSNNLFYDAVAGYDNSTGWGSFIGTALASDLVGYAVPTITSFSPSSGTVGTSVTITGTGLAGVTSVAFGSVAATIVSQTGTQLVTTVPTGAISAPIYISTPEVTVASSTNFVVTQAPTIVSITPSTGTVGSTVYIAGTDFATTDSTGAVLQGGSLTFTSATGQVQASITQPSDNWIIATVPTGAITGPITVTSPSGSVTSTTNYTVLGSPTISSVTPLTGTAGITVVTINGEGLTGSTVTFDGTTATLTADSGTAITTTVPSGALSGPIVVTNTYGSTKFGTNFVVAGTAPTITSVSPMSGPVGTSVTITGTNLNDASGGVPTVTLNGISAKVTSASATSLAVTVPTTATTGKFAVTTYAGSVTSSATFTVTANVPVPTITSFTPTSGPAGTSVTITGTNFSGVSSVKFHGTAATTFLVKSATSLTATVPTGATSGTVSVIAAGGTATSTGSFSVTPPPTISSFTPTTGLAALGKTAGTTVTISGTNLSGATVVAFNGVAAKITGDTATTIKTTVPAGASTGKITVTTANGTATSAATFTVTPVPSITSFTPGTGGPQTVVTVTGSGFVSVQYVKLNGLVLQYKLLSSTAIQFNVPTTASSGYITVTTSFGTTTSTSKFVFVR